MITIVCNFCKISAKSLTRFSKNNNVLTKCSQKLVVVCVKTLIFAKCFSL
jgi:hypothetical protein